MSISYGRDERPLDLPVCKVARAKTAYSEDIKIPEDVKSHITAYKKSWSDLCDRIKSASVYQTFSMAKTLEKKFEQILNLRSLEKKSPDENINSKKTDAAHDYLEKELTKFIPAFEGSILEYEFFRPVTSEFKEISKYGNADDKLFFNLLTEMQGDSMLPPWYEMVSDHGGCLRFGEYDWIMAFEKLKEAKKIKGTQYINVISELQKSLEEDIEGLYYEFSDKELNDICTCKKKNDVKSDLEKLVTYFNKDKSQSKMVAKLQKILEAIKAGKISVNSQAEKHCSGG